MHILATPVREEMENNDIEDGEILEDESNSSEQTFQNKDETQQDELKDTKLEVKNNFEKYFRKEHHKNHHHGVHKGSRRERFPDLHKKRKRIDGDDKYYTKKSKCEDEEDETDEDMIFVLGGSLKDTERSNKHSKKPILPDPPDDLLDPMIFNEGENEDPRPYSKRSPSARRDNLKERSSSRGGNAPLLRRRGGRGGAMLRKNRIRDGPDSFFSQGKSQRNNDCNSFPHSFNHPRKLEICKFYLKDTCNKREKCIYMHEDFPCQHFHAPNSTCYAGKNCKYYHGKLDEVQRAVVKKYADIPLKEADELQERYYHESGDNTYTPRVKKEKVKELNSRIPSLFDIKVAVPPEFRGTEGILSENENPAEAEGQTPIPSPQSMMYDAIDLEEDIYPHTKNHEHKILSEHNDHRRQDSPNERVVFEEEVHRSSHKKRSKKSDDHHSDNEKPKKHSEKRKKRSKEERKSDKEKKKKREHKRSKVEHIDLSPEPEDLFPQVDLPLIEDTVLEATVAPEEYSQTKVEQKEPADALSRLPKKQQELFLRIQQHQKEAETSQSSNVEEDMHVEDVKPDENWYSSDEEQEPSPETTSPLATLLRTIKTSTSNVSQVENQTPCISTHVESSITPTPASRTPPQENDSISMVDPSQLASINLSDDLTKILTSIVLPETSSSSSVPSVTDTLTANPDKENSSLKGPFSEAPRIDLITNSNKKVAEDVDLRFPPPNLINNSLFSTISSSPKDIDLRQLPFKPIPVHDAANEINASITSHPPIEYKLKPLPFIPKVNYAALPEVAKSCPSDPRFKKKAAASTTATATGATAASTPSTPESVDPAQLLSAFNPSDPRHLLALKTMNETARMDPRLLDPRPRTDPRLLDAKVGGAGAGGAVPPQVSAMKCDMRLTTDPRFDAASATAVGGSAGKLPDFRDPRLSSRPKFPEVVNPYLIGLPPNLALPVVKDPPMPPRKEDPRLRFRATQNS